MPLGDTHLSQMRAGVTGQSLAVLEKFIAELTADVAGGVCPRGWRGGKDGNLGRARGIRARNS